MTLLRARPLLWFFVLAYAVTWVLWIPLVVGGGKENGEKPQGFSKAKRSSHERDT